MSSEVRGIRRRIRCLKNDYVRDILPRRSQDSRQQERQVSKNAKMVRHRWIFPRPRRRRVSVLAYRKGQGCQVQGRFDDQKEEFSLSTRVETCCSGRETKKKRRGGRRRGKKEEGKRRRRRRRGERGRGVFIFIVAPRLQVHLFVASSRTNKPTNSSFAFTCSFTSWQRCVVAMVAMVAKPIKVQGSVQHPHMVPTNPKKKSFNQVSPSSRLHRPDFSLRLHASGWTGTKRRTPTNCVSKPLIGNPGGTDAADRGLHFLLSFRG